MKVIHIESGLGNQMLSYCEYLAMKEANPDDKCYIETIVYDIPECNDVICQWNGYELERIFHVSAPNIKEYFDDAEWQAIIRDIRDSQFWLRNWNYPVHFTNAFKAHGLELKNMRGDFEAPGAPHKTQLSTPAYKKTFAFLYLNLIRKKLSGRRQTVHANPSELFVSTPENVFTGQRLTFKNAGNEIERIDSAIRETFRFPALTHPRDLAFRDEIQSTESVAIHARYGDMMSFNFDCYFGGYFKRAVGYIKREIPQPRFYVFCDPTSVDWAKHHSSILGLDMRNDIVKFVNWNTGDLSWRDMQLISMGKHQVITRSSFGWWGAYLNRNPRKMTCSPDSFTNTTHHF